MVKKECLAAQDHAATSQPALKTMMLPSWYAIWSDDAVPQSTTLDSRKDSLAAG